MIGRDVFSLYCLSTTPLAYQSPSAGMSGLNTVYRLVCVIYVYVYPTVFDWLQETYVVIYLSYKLVFSIDALESCRV